MSKRKKNRENRKPGAGKNSKIVALYKPMDSKGKGVPTAVETLKAVGYGLLGTAIGLGIGKPSLWLGIGASVAGNVLDFQPLKIASIGMIATGGYQYAKNLSGTEEEGFEGVKERLKAFGTNLKENLYLNKLLKKKEDVSGLGEVGYFKDPRQEELNMGSLNALEDEIASSGAAFHEQISGTEDEVQILGVEDDDRIY